MLKELGKLLKFRRKRNPRIDKLAKLLHDGIIKGLKEGVIEEKDLLLFVGENKKEIVDNIVDLLNAITEV